MTSAEARQVASDNKFPPESCPRGNHDGLRGGRRGRLRGRRSRGPGGCAPRRALCALRPRRALPRTTAPLPPRPRAGKFIHHAIDDTYVM